MEICQSVATFVWVDRELNGIIYSRAGEEEEHTSKEGRERTGAINVRRKALARNVSAMLSVPHQTEHVYSLLSLLVLLFPDCGRTIGVRISTNPVRP